MESGNKVNYINLLDNYTWHSPYTWLHVLGEQPPEQITSFLYIKQNSLSKKWYAHFQYHTLPCYAIELPHAVGDIVGYRETWASRQAPSLQDNKDYTEYFYKSDRAELMYTSGIKWHSPVTMPREAIRKWLKITSVYCKRVQLIPTEIRRNILNSSGKFKPEVCMPSLIDSYFVTWFNDHYAKPKAVKEHGKIVGYVCYLYDDTPESRIYITKVPNFDKYHENIDIEIGDKLGYYDTWKGLPLEIIENPYLLLCMGKEYKKPRQTLN